MKVDCAQFFLPSCEVGDHTILDDMCHLLCDTHKQILFRDRFNYFNNFSNVNWIDDKDFLSISEYGFGDFDDICRKMALFLLEKKTIILMCYLLTE